MNKPLLVASSVVLGLAAAPVLAQQTPGSNPFIDYITGQIGIADLEDFDEGLALILSAGKTVAPNFSVEGELSTTVSAAEAEAAGTDIEVDYWTAGAYGVYALPVGQSFAVRGRLGGVYTSYDVDGTSDIDDDDFAVSFGVGGLYDLSPRLNLIAEFTRMNDDLNHLSAGVQFKF